LVAQYAVSFFDSATLAKWLRINAAQKWIDLYWGVYSVHQDTIHAIIYIQYFGTIFKPRQLRETHFRGIIRDSGIAQWQAIPPWPAKVEIDQRNKHYLDWLRQPKTLYFKATSVKSGIDTAAAWISQNRS